MGGLMEGAVSSASPSVPCTARVEGQCGRVAIRNVSLNYAGLSVGRSVAVVHSTFIAVWYTLYSCSRAPTK